MLLNLQPALLKRCLYGLLFAAILVLGISYCLWMQRVPALHLIGRYRLFPGLEPNYQSRYGFLLD